MSNLDRAETKRYLEALYVLKMRCAGHFTLLGEPPRAGLLRGVACAWGGCFFVGRGGGWPLPTRLTPASEPPHPTLPTHPPLIIRPTTGPPSSPLIEKVPVQVEPEDDGAPPATPTSPLPKHFF